MKKWHPIQCGEFRKSSANDDWAIMNLVEREGPGSTQSIKNARKQQKGPAQTRHQGTVLTKHIKELS